MQLAGAAQGWSCLGAKEGNGANKPRARAKQWVVQATGEQQEQAAGRIKEPCSCGVFEQLSSSVTGLKMRTGGRRKCGSGGKIRTLLRWTIMGIASGGVIWLGLLQLLKVIN